MWLQTKTGQAFRLDGSFTADEVKLEDIAHALGMICRYGGHSKVFYSVAEHSVNVMRRVRELVRHTDIPYQGKRDLVRAALFHDAAEAYVGDIPTPLKRWLGPEFRELEDATMATIAAKFELKDYHHPFIKQADLECLASERDQVFDTPPPRAWSGDLDIPDPWRGCEVLGWGPALAKQRFIGAAESLGVSWESA